LPEALRDTQAALERAPDDMNVLFLHAMVLLRNKQLDEAISAFSRVLAQSKGHPGAHLYRGYAYHQQGKLGEAMNDYDELLVVAGPQAYGYMGRADIHYLNGKYDLAILDYSRAVELEPHGLLWARLIWLNVTCPDERLRRIEDAKAAALDTLKTPGLETPHLIAALAAAEAASGQYDEAVKRAEAAITGLGDSAEEISRLYANQLAEYRGKRPHRETPEERAVLAKTSVLDQFLRNKWANVAKEPRDASATNDAGAVPEGGGAANDASE
jgi:tetratricopeptide (TPR) repeat protein